MDTHFHTRQQRTHNTTDELKFQTNKMKKKNNFEVRKFSINSYILCTFCVVKLNIHGQTFLISGLNLWPNAFHRCINTHR